MSYFVNLLFEEICETQSREGDEGGRREGVEEEVQGGEKMAETAGAGLRFEK